MKSKPLTYLLLVVVGIVWYNVFFRIKSNLMGDDVPPPVSNAQQLVLKPRERDTFSLHANYRDPFEGMAEKPVAAVADNSVNPLMPVQQFPVKSAPPPPRPHQWPKVKYYGVMKKTGGKQALCIVNIDDMLFNLREGEYILDGYMIKDIYRDSVVIQYKKLKRTFRK